MPSKFVEISAGQNLPPKKFEILEVEKNTFMLKTKNSYAKVLWTLQKWLQNNYLVKEVGYSEMLCKRSNFMVEEAHKAYNLLIGGEDRFMQWSVSQKKVITAYDDVMAGGIRSMAKINDKDCLF